MTLLFNNFRKKVHLFLLLTTLPLSYSLYLTHKLYTYSWTFVYMISQPTTSFPPLSLITHDSMDKWY